MRYVLHEAKNKKDIQDFLALPARLYKNNPIWIRPLDKDIEAVFDPKKNSSFAQGECCRWLLKDENNQVAGRVAAFVDHNKKNLGAERPTGGMGFFECVEDQAAAFQLFDACKNWLHCRDIQAMDGPVNFGNRDKWWGLLIEGFDKAPNYQTNYNFPYYKDFFEAYGFAVLFGQITYGRLIHPPVKERMQQKADLIDQQKGVYHFAYLPKKEWHSLPEKICAVYNKAWANRQEIPELSLRQSQRLVKAMKPIMDEKLLWFGYCDNEPIAFFLSIPDINRIVKRLHGQFNWLAKLKFLWHSKTLPNRKIIGILFGVTPEHQGKGVDGAIIRAFQEMAKREKFHYQEIELNWIADFNVKMMRVAEQIDTQVIKRHATYRKTFD